MAAESRTTTDHDEIRRWAEERGGTPASVRDTGEDEAGVLRVDLPGGAGGVAPPHAPWAPASWTCRSSPSPTTTPGGRPERSTTPRACSHRGRGLGIRSR